MLSSKMGGRLKRRARDACADENWAVLKEAEEKVAEDLGDPGEDDSELLELPELWLLLGDGRRAWLAVGTLEMLCRCFCSASCLLCSSRYFCSVNARSGDFCVGLDIIDIFDERA